MFDRHMYIEYATPEPVEMKQKINSNSPSLASAEAQSLLCHLAR